MQNKQSRRRFYFRVVLSCLVLVFLTQPADGQRRSRNKSLRKNPAIPLTKLLPIVQAEDERRWDTELQTLLTDKSAGVRTRAALAAGRIGDEKAVAALVEVMTTDNSIAARNMAAFALGEIESAQALEALLEALKTNKQIRARAVEALGKIAAALPKTEEARSRAVGQAIVDVLRAEAQKRSLLDTDVVLLALTAALRARPEGPGAAIIPFLSNANVRVRADAANALARLRARDGNEQLRKMLIQDPDPIVRANAARVLGATEDRPSRDALLDRALHDKDSRVRVSSLRSVGALKDSNLAGELLRRGEALSKPDLRNRPPQTNEVLEIANALGRTLMGTGDAAAVAWLREISTQLARHAPEVEIALARVSPQRYLETIGTGESGKRKAQETILLDWRAASAIAQGLGELANMPETMKDRAELNREAQQILEGMLDYRNSGIIINTLVAVHSEYAIPDVLRAFAAFAPTGLAGVLRKHLTETDVIVRTTAAELLGSLVGDETNVQALVNALTRALQDIDNDAALAILDSLGKAKTSAATEALKRSLDSSDHLVRRRAVALLKANSAGDFSDRIGLVKTQNTATDYRRALSRIDHDVQALITTSRGSFTVELLPADAPLNVDNFIKLAQRNFFRGITIHRVVPNFVIQDGDPRGDGNGGPGYQIRCEINTVPYERAAMGMALSGKDTGGSQWFVTHSPQPHLDGGYTVFGRVIAGMSVVDTIVRGDTIISVVITERPRTGK